jgi:hypothetical protein
VGLPPAQVELKALLSEVPCERYLRASRVRVQRLPYRDDLTVGLDQNGGYLVASIELRGDLASVAERCVKAATRIESGHAEKPRIAAVNASYHDLAIGLHRHGLCAVCQEVFLTEVEKQDC